MACNAVIHKRQSYSIATLCGHCVINVFGNLADFFAYDDEWQINRYCLPRATPLCDQSRTNQGHTHGGPGAGDRSGITQPFTSNVMPAEQQHVMEDFMHQTGFSNVQCPMVGLKDVLDCTHVTVPSPLATEQVWRCLDASRGRLLYKPSKVCQIIWACCALHNICMSHGLEMPEGKMHMVVAVDPCQLPATHVTLHVISTGSLAAATSFTACTTHCQATNFILCEIPLGGTTCTSPHEPLPQM
ncbi:hypothetical protein H4Q32_029796 [Labeo rohita]|uniref:Nuclease HARBI1 n=1 Tax=Labeo rohita TaxID=84645 RepID=A0ABQ8M308_LABRO|nr:hypothetical protein H4Q32_029796 [Labeo rohita]